MFVESGWPIGDRIQQQPNKLSLSNIGTCIFSRRVCFVSTRPKKAPERKKTRHCLEISWSDHIEKVCSLPSWWRFAVGRSNLPTGTDPLSIPEAAPSDSAIGMLWPRNAPISTNRFRRAMFQAAGRLVRGSMAEIGAKKMKIIYFGC